MQTVTAAGEVLNQYDYDIWGNPTLTVETEECGIRYAGEFLDGESGLYYLRAKYYNSYTGRFISEDSYWGEDENPLSLNRYTYCFNDPISFVDPTGHIVTEWDKEHLNKVEQNVVEDLSNKWNYYNARGDRAAADSVHDLAEKFRDKYRTADEAGSDTGETYKKIASKTQSVTRNLNVNKSTTISANASRTVDNYDESDNAVNNNAEFKTKLIVINGINFRIPDIGDGIIDTKTNSAEEIKTKVLIGQTPLANAVIINGTTYGNIRDVVKDLGGQDTKYDEETRTATFVINDKTIKVNIDTKEYTVNGAKNEGFNIILSEEGHLQLGVRDIANLVGLGNTVDYFTDKDNNSIIRVNAKGLMANDSLSMVKLSDWANSATGRKGYYVNDYGILKYNVSLDKDNTNNQSKVAIAMLDAAMNHSTPIKLLVTDNMVKPMSSMYPQVSYGHSAQFPSISLDEAEEKIVGQYRLGSITKEEYYKEMRKVYYGADYASKKEDRSVIIEVNPNFALGLPVTIGKEKAIKYNDSGEVTKGEDITVPTSILFMHELDHSLRWISGLCEKEYSVGSPNEDEAWAVFMQNTIVQELGLKDSLRYDGDPYTLEQSYHTYGKFRDQSKFDKKEKSPYVVPYSKNSTFEKNVDNLVNYINTYYK